MDDLISRNAALDAVELGITYAKVINIETGEATELFKASNTELRKAIDRIKALPTAQLERKKGEWIPVTNGRGGFECDQCHNYAPSYQNGVEWLSGFCPNCGADMRGGEQNGEH